VFGYLFRHNSGDDEIRIDAAAELFDKGEVRLVDVREPAEWARGHIPGAIHLPLSRLPHGISQLPKDKPVVLYCVSGNRSGHALPIFRAHGVNEVKNLHGGIAAWHRHGLPLTL
jgi:rhodanese-related sulfurtransferase